MPRALRLHLRGWGIAAILAAALVVLGAAAEWTFAIAALLGGLVGTTELVSRYRDAPVRAIFTVPAAAYVVINATASAVALAVAQGFGWTFGLDDESTQVIDWTRVAVAGLSSTALFRSALFVRRVGNEDVDVGPSSILKTLLDVTDEAVDRERASEILQAADVLTRRLTYQLARERLVSSCLHAMQSMPPERQDLLAEELRNIEENLPDDGAKRIPLGEVLIKFFGREVVANAVTALEAELQRARATAGAPAPSPSGDNGD